MYVASNDMWAIHSFDPVITYFGVLQGVDAVLHYKPINSAKYIFGKI